MESDNKRNTEKRKEHKKKEGTRKMKRDKGFCYCQTEISSFYKRYLSAVNDRALREIPKLPFSVALIGANGDKGS